MLVKQSKDISLKLVKYLLYFLVLTMISLSMATASNEPEEDDFAFWCDEKSPCTYRNEKLDMMLTLPIGWAMGEPYKWQLAGQGQTEFPTAYFFGPEGSDIMLGLNAKAGFPCIETNLGKGGLCWLSMPQPRSKDDIPLEIWLIAKSINRYQEASE